MQPLLLLRISQLVGFSPYSCVWFIVVWLVGWFFNLIFHGNLFCISVSLDLLSSQC